MALVRFTENGKIHYKFIDEEISADENQEKKFSGQDADTKHRTIKVRSNARSADPDLNLSNNKAGGRNRKDHKKAIAVGIVAALFAIGVGFSYLYSLVNVAGYRQKELTDQIVALQETQEKLQREVSELTSLQRVQKVAVEELGMIAPSSEDVLLVNNNPDESVPEQDTSEQNDEDTSDSDPVVAGNDHTSIIQILAGLIDG